LQVQFAPIQRTQTTRPAKRNEKPASDTNVNRRKTVSVFRSETPDLEPNHYRTNSASPTVPLQAYDEPVNTHSTDVKISSLDDIDAVIAKYKDMCNIGPSPSCSLVLNTPRGIKKAYNSIFHGSSIITDESIIEQTSEYCVESVQQVAANRETNSNCAAQNPRNTVHNSDCNTVQNSATNSEYPTQNSGSYSNHSSRPNMVPIHNPEYITGPVQNSGYPRQNPVPNTTSGINSEYPVQNSRQNPVPNRRESRTSTPNLNYPIQNIRQHGSSNWEHVNPRPNRDPVPNCESVHPSVEVDISCDLTDYHEYEGSVLLEENNRGGGNSSFIRQEERRQSSR
jgi:hypothetical protein